jgi:hypothetical protein
MRAGMIIGTYECERARTAGRIHQSYDDVAYLHYEIPLQESRKSITKEVRETGEVSVSLE